MRSSFVARALALAAFTIAACEGNGGPGPGEPPAPTTDPALLPAGVPVVVANTAANPVVTQAAGTTTVAGTVTANQGGAWNVRVNNASLPVEGTVAVSGGTVAATQQGPWSVAVSEPVAIAPGASVAISALPPVTLAGTPQVTIAGAPQVTIAGTTAVTGNVGVTGAVTIANSPTVALEPGAVVEVGNDAANPVLVKVVDDAGRQPVSLNPQFNLGVTIGGSNAPFYTVPAGKLLVLEHVSVRARLTAPDATPLDPPAFVVTELIVEAGAASQTLTLPLEPQGVRPDGGLRIHLFSASLPMRAYAPAGTALSCRQIKTAQLPSNVEYNITGYLTDAP